MITIFILRHTHTHIQLLLQFTNAWIMEPFRSNKKHGRKMSENGVKQSSWFTVFGQIRRSGSFVTWPLWCFALCRDCCLTLSGLVPSLRLPRGQREARMGDGEALGIRWISRLAVGRRVTGAMVGKNYGFYFRILEDVGCIFVTLNFGWKRWEVEACLQGGKPFQKSCVCVLTKCELLHWLSRLIWISTMSVETIKPNRRNQFDHLLSLWRSHCAILADLDLEATKIERISLHCHVSNDIHCCSISI